MGWLVLSRRVRIRPIRLVPLRWHVRLTGDAPTVGGYNAHEFNVTGSATQVTRIVWVTWRSAFRSGRSFGEMVRHIAHSASARPHPLVKVQSWTRSRPTR